ncbi:class I SAM-dependent methyltransferase [Goodfellowiella coeruleoviolacea]|uniref:Methyltransferase domain-containing protein n=1 Tax=Goodfellowiella coeruleoviolacea TaxID=334858 RepID=A0AAE3GJA2_9PSEU|nr:class I SAM-dependent methyltransferase [Goodfellowiella coeruleoviolacea]MCP2168588.1 Methyltransferase domain-containing protein [Goodfellowiella coeruleoviolacea]
MQGYQQSTYGDRIADSYDQLHGNWSPTDTVDTVVELADGGPVLELGVGTGRVALPLARRGVKVTGVDVSEPMLAQLREKDPDGLVETVLGDFIDMPVRGRFKVVLVVNSLLQLAGADTQRLCLRNIARHLAPDGVLVLEEANPAAFTRSGLEVLRITSDELHLLAAQYDPVHQHYFAQHVVLRDGQTRLHPMALRLTSTCELDLMCEAAGLRLVGRWGDWARTRPFLAGDRSHISLYRPVEA